MKEPWFFINFFRKNFGRTKKSSNFALANETSHLQNQNGALVQLVRMPACHAGGRWFESCTHRKTRKQSRSRVFYFCPPQKNNKPTSLFLRKTAAQWKPTGSLPTENLHHLWVIFEKKW